MSIIADFQGILQVFSDGSFKRSQIPATDPSPEFTGGFKTKDVVVNTAKPVTARIFVPDTQDQLHRLPVLLYFHGGGFCIGTTVWQGFHDYLGGLCVKSQALILSVDYRLAPEHKIPAQYDDCYESVQWLATNAKVEPWIERADLSRVFLSGESAGANIVHHVAVRTARERIDGINIRGLIVIHPFFGSKERVESERAKGVEKWVEMGELYWKLSLPEGADRDHWASNFEKVEMDAEQWKRFPAAVMVSVAGLDLLRERGIMYAEFLKKKGLDVEVVVSEGQQHAFHVFNSGSQAAHLLQSQMADYLKHHSLGVL